MPSDRPDPSEFLAAAQRMLRELFGDSRGTDEDPWAGATRESRESRLRTPSPEEQRENLTFALATRAVEALEDLALNVAGDPPAPRADGAPSPPMLPDLRCSPGPPMLPGPVTEGTERGDPTGE